ncbi:MAG TPA: glycosyltransferase [Terriglobales bacterium]|nr:glycosyltransferase [Terriglobales bacterium]
MTVGNARHGSLRLLNAVEKLVTERFFGEVKVVVQSGNNAEFRSEHCEVRPFLSMDEFVEMIHRSSLVICHAGCGTLSQAIKEGKPIVVVPRRLHYNEVVDDHQPQLLEAFAKRGLVIPAYEVEELPGAIEKARAMPIKQFQETSAAPAKIMAAVEDLLNRR